MARPRNKSIYVDTPRRRYYADGIARQFNAMMCYLADCADITPTTVYNNVKIIVQALEQDSQ